MAQNWVNETTYAKQYLRMRAYAGMGLQRIRQELKQKGISDTDFASALMLFEEEEFDWFLSAKEQRQKKFGEPIPLDAKQRQKQQRYLFNRGFCTPQIHYACSGD